PSADPPTQVITLPEQAKPARTPGRGVAGLATGPIAFAGATLARLTARRQREQPGEAAPTDPPPPPELRAVVMAEENKIRQVLANLIANAMRFTPEGSPVELGVGVDAAKRVAV